MKCEQDADFRVLRQSVTDRQNAMAQIGGLLGVFAAIIVSYVISGGHIMVVVKSMGPELLCIGGSGLATLFISNDISVVKGLMGNFKRTFSGSRWKRSDYTDALCMMFMLARVAKSEGNMVLERHIEKVEESAIFNRFPRLVADKGLIGFVTDVLRSVTLNFTDPHEVGEMMEREVEKRHHEQVKLAKALSHVGDAFPALGIVAAVLGVIKAMGAISEPPEVLGEMIGSALVGTFLGVLLSYGLVGPIATRLKGVFDEERIMLDVIRTVIASHLHGLAPQLSVEIGRKAIPSKYQPSFTELDGILQQAARSARESK